MKARGRRQAAISNRICFSWRGWAMVTAISSECSVESRSANEVVQLFSHTRIQSKTASEVARGLLCTAER